MQNNRMFRLSSIISLVVGVFLLWCVGSWVRSAFMGRLIAGASVRIAVEQPLSSKEIARLLLEKKIISSALGYRVYVTLARENGARVGNYDLYPGTAYQDIARALARGPVRIEREVRVIEGWDITEEAAKLSTMNPDWGSAFTDLVGTSGGSQSFDPSWRTEFSFLQSLPANRSLDGYLFPDTYRVWEDEVPEGLVRKQLQTFESRLYKPYKDVALPKPLTSFDQAVILASIVEKEVPSAKDRGIVAGIFLRRLNEGMALQSDATLTYVTGSNRGRATADELALESAYNSYKHAGLPPGPIAQPALSAMEAVMHPTPSTYRYFLTDKHNNVLYASTFEEHIRNRQRAGY